MRRKAVLMAIALGLVVCSLLLVIQPSHAYPTSHYLNVDSVTQRDLAWCWAASLRSIMKYHGTAVSQCDIVKDGWQWGYCASWMYGWPDYVPERALSANGFDSTVVAGSISFDSIASELYDDSRPIYARVMYGLASGHAIVLDGYDTSSGQKVRRMEPGDGGYYLCTYNWLLNGGPCSGGSGDNGHSWDATIHNIHD